MFLWMCSKPSRSCLNSSCRRFSKDILWHVPGRKAQPSAAACARTSGGHRRSQTEAFQAVLKRFERFQGGFHRFSTLFNSLRVASLSPRTSLFALVASVIQPPEDDAQPNSFHQLHIYASKGILHGTCQRKLPFLKLLWHEFGCLAGLRLRFQALLSDSSRLADGCHVDSRIALGCFRDLPASSSGDITVFAANRDSISRLFRL